MIITNDNSPITDNSFRFYNLNGSVQLHVCTKY